jgi:hypothetical protein
LHDMYSTMQQVSINQWMFIESINRFVNHATSQSMIDQSIDLWSIISFFLQPNLRNQSHSTIWASQAPGMQAAVHCWLINLWKNWSFIQSTFCSSNIILNQSISYVKKDYRSTVMLWSTRNESPMSCRCLCSRILHVCINTATCINQSCDLSIRYVFIIPFTAQGLFDRLIYHLLRSGGWNGRSMSKYWNNKSRNLVDHGYIGTTHWLIMVEIVGALSTVNHPAIMW